MTPQISRVWPYLAERGFNDLLKRWVEGWIGEGGEAWTSGLAERRDIVSQFVRLARSAGLNDVANAAEDRLRWGRIGYSGHKEYSICALVDWYRPLAIRDAASWKSLGVRLLAVSEEASRSGGDNRAGDSARAVVASAAASAGVGEYWRLLRARGTLRVEPWMESGSRMLIDGLIGMLERGAYSQADLESAWALTVGQLTRQSGHDRMRLADARDAIAFAARRSGVEVRLSELAPAETLALANHDRYRSVNRWFDSDATDATEAPPRLSESQWSATVYSICARLAEDRDSGTGDLWREMARLLRRLGVERPACFRTSLGRMLDAVRANTGRYDWSFDGCVAAVRAIVPLLDEAARWELCRLIPSVLEFDTPDIWIGTAAENLDTLCLSRAEASDAVALRRGCDALLAMHELWIEARGHLPAMNRVAPPPPDAGDPATWPAFAVRVLLDLFEYDDALELSAAIRGVGLLVRVAPESAAHLRDRIEVLARRTAYHLLLAAEAAREQREAWRPMVEQCLRRPELEVSLQAWVVLDAYARAAGEEPRVWTIAGVAPVAAAAPLLGGPKRLLSLPSIEKGGRSFTPGPRAALGLIRQFKDVIDEYADDLEERVAESLAAHEDLEARPRRRPDRRDALTVSTPIAIDRLLDVIADDLRAGRWDGVPPTLLGQALLHGDEPRLIGASPIRAPDAADWPVDSRLEELLKDPKKAENLGSTLLRHLGADLPANRTLVAGVLETFSEQRDVELVVSHFWHRDPRELRRPRIGTTLSGRCFTFFDEDRFEQPPGSPGQWLMLRVGGLVEFQCDHCQFVPSTLWTRELGWTPSPENPLIWLREGTAVAWFERRAGPYRDALRGGDYRQPMLYRWSCLRDALQESVERSGGRLAVETQVAQHTFEQH